MACKVLDESLCFKVVVFDENDAQHSPYTAPEKASSPIAEAAKNITDLDADAVNAVNEEFQATLREISRKFSDKT